MILTPYLRVDINLICLLYLISITFYVLTQLPKKSKLTFGLRACIFMCMAGLAASTIERLLHYTIPNQTTLIFAFVTIRRALILGVSVGWASIATNYVKRKEYDYQSPIYTKAPAIIGVVVLLMNIFIQNVFTVQIEGPKYVKNGDFFFLYYAAIHFYYIYTTFYLIANYKNISKKDFTIFLLFTWVPFLGALVEILNPDLIMLWPLSSISLMITVNHLEKNVVVFDNLTNAMTRAAFEEFVDYLEKKDKRDFSLAFIDLDGFKLINDKFGHAEGDKALRTFATEVINVLPKTSNLIRYGGDEFIVYMDTSNKDIIYGIVGQINEAINKRNASNEKPYNIKYTLSVEPYNKEKHGSISNLIRTLDAEMYTKKNQKKNRLYRR